VLRCWRTKNEKNAFASQKTSFLPEALQGAQPSDHRSAKRTLAISYRICLGVLSHIFLLNHHFYYGICITMVNRSYNDGWDYVIFDILNSGKRFKGHIQDYKKRANKVSMSMAFFC